MDLLPGNYLEECINKEIKILLTIGENIEGKLESYDSNLNLIITEANYSKNNFGLEKIFLKGSHIQHIILKN